jgi:hypothetical protein
VVYKKRENTGVGKFVKGGPSKLLRGKQLFKGSRRDDNRADVGTVVARHWVVTLMCRGRDAKNAETNGNITIAIGQNKTNPTRFGGSEDLIVMEVGSIMSSGCLSTVIEMCTRATKSVIKKWGISDGIIREEVVQETISRDSGGVIGMKVMK